VCELNPSEETTSHGSAVCEEQQLYPVLWRRWAPLRVSRPTTATRTGTALARHVTTGCSAKSSRIFSSWVHTYRRDQGRLLCVSLPQCIELLNWTVDYILARERSELMWTQAGRRSPWSYSSILN
jgi:hypothetical protein